jgi:hypothetical protein
MGLKDGKGTTIMGDVPIISKDNKPEWARAIESLIPIINAVHQELSILDERVKMLEAKASLPLIPSKLEVVIKHEEKQ